jgi:hypothetical protein
MCSRRWELYGLLAIARSSDVQSCGTPWGQYQIGKFFWPEIENNATFYHGGPNDGRVPNFVTPGLMLSRCRLEHDPRNRLALVLGGGMQIAASQFHTSNHGLVLTARRLF